MFFFLCLLYFFFLVVFWSMTLFGLPGNWLIVLGYGLFTWLGSEPQGALFSWWVFGFLIALAVIGEVIELLSSAYGLKKGGSRKGALLALLGSFAGSFLGFILAFPIPVLGPLVGMVLFSAVGAMAGAYAGELWSGKPQDAALELGQIAFWARIMGTFAKVLIGSMMIALAVISIFL
jgi:hypothetical protein